MSLPANWTAGNQFTAANENSVETAVNASTNTLAAASAAPAASVLALYDAHSNLSANNFIESFATTVTSGSPIVLTVSSARTQVLTGSTPQTVTLPTTGVVAGTKYTIVNQSSALATVQSSGSNTVGTVSGEGAAPFVSATFTALVATPTTAANWTYAPGGSTVPVANHSAIWDASKNLSANDFIPAFNTTATAGTTLTLTVTAAQVQVLTGVTTHTVLLPTTGVVAGQEYFVINQSSGVVTVQSSGANTVLALAGSAASPFASARFTALVATPTTAANWDVAQFGANAALGTPASGVLTNCTGGPTLTSATLVTPALGTPASGVMTNVTGLPVGAVTGATTVTSGTATATTVDTPLAAYTCPANSLAAGTTFSVKVGGIQTVASGVVTFNVRIGTATTTAGSTIVASVAPAFALAGGGFVDALLTVRTTGAGGTCIASGIGVGSTVVNSTATLTQTVSTTVQNFVSISASAAAGTFTTSNVFIAPNV